MKAKRNRVRVFWREVTNKCSEKEAADAIGALFRAAGFERLVVRDGFCMLKLHFGERGNPNHIEAKFVRPLVEILKSYKMKVFCSDTNTLYRGGRHNAVEHLMTAYEHGFTPEYLGCPVIIADGLVGMCETKVKIKGKHFSEVALAADLEYVDTLFVLSHLTGHIAVGMGCAIKNLGMGLATRGGKLAQHNAQPLEVDERKCVACGFCAEHCPQEAIKVGKVAKIDSKRCINCGYCIAVCKPGAVKFSWEISSQVLQERIAEYAAGVLIKVKNVGFFNFLLKIAKDCDCIGEKSDIICDDVGVLASDDVVAIDAASCEIVKEAAHND
ncbi:MAG: DUF362 domain-containing protein, partial [Planctomycetota bacterium]|nr:DUF362 domain-containing protein [Planctomycetota bacterium]